MYPNPTLLVGIACMYPNPILYFRLLPTVIAIRNNVQFLLYSSKLPFGNNNSSCNFFFYFFLFVSLYLVVKKEKEECVQFFFFMKNLTKNNAQGSLLVSVIETVYHSFPKKKKKVLFVGDV